MYAEKLILETDDAGMPKNFPVLPQNKQFEVIFLMLDDEPVVMRKPHPSIAGKAVICGDVINTAAQTEWGLPK